LESNPLKKPAKLEPLLSGSYQVLPRISNVTYSLELKPYQSLHIVVYDGLFKFYQTFNSSERPQRPQDCRSASFYPWAFPISIAEVMRRTLNATHFMIILRKWIQALSRDTKTPWSDQLPSVVPIPGRQLAMCKKTNCGPSLQCNARFQAPGT